MALNTKQERLHRAIGLAFAATKAGLFKKSRKGVDITSELAIRECAEDLATRLGDGFAQVDREIVREKGGAQ